MTKKSAKKKAAPDKILRSSEMTNDVNYGS